VQDLVKNKMEKKQINTELLLRCYNTFVLLRVDSFGKTTRH